MNHFAEHSSIDWIKLGIPLLALFVIWTITRLLKLDRRHKKHGIFDNPRENILSNKQKMALIVCIVFGGLISFFALSTGVFLSNESAIFATTAACSLLLLLLSKRISVSQNHKLTTWIVIFGLPFCVSIGGLFFREAPWSVVFQGLIFLFLGISIGSYFVIFLNRPDQRSNKLAS